VSLRFEPTSAEGEGEGIFISNDELLELLGKSSELELLLFIAAQGSV